MDREKYLPIGSVVMIKETKVKMMITGYVAKGKETGDKVYDYIGCVYPLGVLTSEQTFLFNHENIEKIVFVGYEGEEWKEFSPEIKKIAEQSAQESAKTSNQESTETPNQKSTEASNQEAKPNNEEISPIDTNITNL